MKGPKKYKKQNKRKYDFPIEKSVEHANESRYKLSLSTSLDIPTWIPKLQEDE